MRIALVSPYSWSYPGGVTRHIDALGRELERRGHEVTTLAPYDPQDRLAALLHRGALPAQPQLPPGFISLGRTVGFPANGAVSNLAVGSHALLTMRKALREGRFDVVHIHEPVAPLISWDALCSVEGPALVGTFHSYSENPLTNGIGILLGARRRMRRLHVRIAVSEAARWTAARFFGGNYLVIPNGVEGGTDRPRQEREGPLQILFIGQAVERKGLAVLLKAFEAVRDQLPATLTLVGPTWEEVEGLLLEPRGVRVLGRLDERSKREELAQADLLCAPSLGGESFGIVLAEAFSFGLPVIASRIPGYSDLVRDGEEGVLVEPGDPLALAGALRLLAVNRPLRQRLAQRARERAAAYSWQTVATQVEQAYALALERRAAERSAGAALALRFGFRDRSRLTGRAAGEEGRGRPRHGGTVRLFPKPTRRRILTATTAAAFGGAAYGVAAAGPPQVATSLVLSKPALVGGAAGLMAGALLLRARAWQLLLRLRSPFRWLGFGPALRATAIGVLLSATLPARLGEPSRALVIAGRFGNARSRLPTVFATVAAQLEVNLLAVGGLLAGSLLGGGKGGLAGWPVGVALGLVGAAAVSFLPVIVPGSARGRTVALPGLWEELRDGLSRLAGGVELLRERAAWRPVACQLSAWVAQLCAVYALLGAFGLAARLGLGGACAVLFAINAAALVPASPGNIGVFQLAVVAVLAGFGVGAAPALAFGLVLQGLELAVAVAFGLPCLKAEGLTYNQLRRRCLNAMPVSLSEARERAGG